MFLAKSVSIHSVSSMDPTSLLPRERLAVLNFSLGHVGPGLGGERGAHPWKKMGKAIRLERNVLKYFKPLLWPADRDKLTHFQKTTTSSQKSKTCWSSESNHIYIILKASVNFMVAFEEMIWFMEGINVSSPISLNLLWSLRLSLIYHFKKNLWIGIMKVWRAISMNETTILLRDIYVAVNQLSNWRCFDSKVSHKLSAEKFIFNFCLSCILPVRHVEHVY